MSTIIFEFKPGFPSIQERLKSILENLLLNPMINFNSDNTQMNIKMENMCCHIQAIIAVVCDAYPVIAFTYMK